MRIRKLAVVSYDYEEVKEAPEGAKTPGEIAKMTGKAMSTTTSWLARLNAKGLAKKYKLGYNKFVWIVNKSALPEQQETEFDWYDILCANTKSTTKNSTCYVNYGAKKLSPN